MKKTSLVMLACASVFALSTASFAQESDASDASAQPEKTGAARAIMNRVEVRARKKSKAEEAQSVPITLTALNAAQIDAIFAEDLSDVGMTMPNVRLDDVGVFPGTANYTIRGMGFNSSIASVEPTVGVFVDGMYLGQNLGGELDTFDLESIEVLRGPQGTLFGRNVTGGAVVVRTARPDGEFGAKLKAGIGSGERREIAGSIENGLTDQLAGKIFISYSDREGDFDNLATGEKHGAETKRFIRPTLRWQGDNGSDISLIAEHGDVQGDGVNNRFVDDDTTLLYNLFGLRAPTGGADKINIDRDGNVEIDWNSVVLDASWDVGSGTLTSITGYRDVDYASASDSDGTGSDIASATNAVTQDQFSQEVRYANTFLNDKLDMTVGANYFQQSMDQTYEVIFFGSSFSRSYGTQDHTAAGIFAQGDYWFTDDLTLTVGGRFTWEEKEARLATTQNCTLALECTLSKPGKKSWEKFSPKIGLSWQASEDVLFYGSWTQGFRSGGYNIRTTDNNGLPANGIPVPYEPEMVDAFEVGLKSDFLNNRARVNAAVFHNEYEDLQRTVNDGLTNYIRNVAAATIDGVEVDATFLPIDTLALSASVGWLDATYDEYDSDGDGTPNAELTGNVLPRAPKWSYTFTATHDLNLGELGDLSTRISWSHNGKTAANDGNNYFVPEWDILNGSISWTPASNNALKVSLWGKNLTNETYALTGTWVGGVFTNLYQALPRRYGVELTYQFGS